MSDRVRAEAIFARCGVWPLILRTGSETLFTLWENGEYSNLFLKLNGRVTLWRWDEYAWSKMAAALADQSSSSAVINLLKEIKSETLEFSERVVRLVDFERALLGIQIGRPSRAALDSLLTAIDIADDWATSLGKHLLDWPRELDRAADTLADVILFGEIDEGFAAATLARLRVDDALRDAIASCISLSVIRTA